MTQLDLNALERLSKQLQWHCDTLDPEEREKASEKLIDPSYVEQATLRVLEYVSRQRPNDRTRLKQRLYTALQRMYQASKGYTND